MAKFVMECPHCGKFAEAKTGFFARKKIDCTCGYVIDLRTDKLASRECPHCGNNVVFDQSKGENKYNSANEKYESGDYIAAIQIWTELEDYKDSSDRIQDCVINICDEVLILIDEGNYEKAKETLTQVKSYVGAESNNVYEVCTGWLILIDCIDIIEAGGSINLTDIYDRIAELPPEVDCAKFYDLDLIKQVEYLGTTWKLQTALCNGERNESYEQDQYGYSFEGGKFILLDKNGAEDTSWDLYYTNGIFSAGSQVSGDSYRIITQFDGVGDITINVKHVFDSSYDGTHYEWNETLNRQ